MRRSKILAAVAVCSAITCGAFIGASGAENAVPPPSGGAYGGGACLSVADGRRVLQSSGAITLGEAVKVARDSTPGEIVDYKICPAASGYSYVLTILGGGGKVARAWVDAASGKLLSVD